MTPTQSDPAPPPMVPIEHATTAALEHLSTQLISTGHLRHPLPPNTFASSLDGQEALTRAIFSLIASHHEAIRRRETMNAEKREADYEYGRLVRMVDESKRETVKANQIASGCESKLSAAVKSLEEEKSQHRKTKEEFNRLTHAERLVRASCSQDIRKRSLEMEELQKRLSNRLLDGSNNANNKERVSISVGLEVREGWVTGGRKTLLDIELEGAHRVREKVLAENFQLRDLVRTWESGLVELTYEVDGVEVPNHDHEEQAPSMLIRDLDMPTSKLFERLSSLTYDLREKLCKIKESREEAVQSLKGLEARFEDDRVSVDEACKARLEEKEREIEGLKLALEEMEKVVDGWTKAGFEARKTTAWVDDSMAEDPIVRSTPMNAEAGPSKTTMIDLQKQEFQRIDHERKLQMAEYEERQRRILEDLKSPAQDQHPPEPADDTLKSLVVFTKSSNKQKQKGVLISKKTTKTEAPQKKTKSSLSTRTAVASVKAAGVSSTRTSLRRQAPIKSALNSVLAATGDSDRLGRGSEVQTTSAPAPATTSAPTSAKPTIETRPQARVPIVGRGGGGKISRMKK